MSGPHPHRGVNRLTVAAAALVALLLSWSGPAAAQLSQVQESNLSGIVGSSSETVTAGGRSYAIATVNGKSAVLLLTR
jgi:hypothetical protein